MKLKVLLIDDEPDALAKLHNYVARVPWFEIAAECNGPSEAMEYLANARVDVIFTDIDMPDINGIDFIAGLDPRPITVFVTAYREYAADGFKLSATDYLVKPYGTADFQRAANKVLEIWRARNEAPAEVRAPKSDDALFVKVNTRFERLDVNSIVFIKGCGEYLQIHTDSDPRPFMTITSFPLIMEKLGNNFLQVHRSYVVNMNRVKRIERQKIITDTNVVIPISAGQKDELKAYLEIRTVGKMLK